MSPRDRVALIIASGLVAWGVVMIIGSAWRGQPISTTSGEIFLAVATGLCTALGAYFATRNNGNHK
jgi:hypothetical protein